MLTRFHASAISAAALFAAAILPNTASAFVVDSASESASTILTNLQSGWGIAYNSGTDQFDYTGVAGMSNILAYKAEDSDDSAGHGGHLAIAEGGQDYDVEFIGAGVQGGKLYLTIVSGLRPDNGATYFAPGDIHIMVDNTTTYGIEVGGGAGGSTGTAIDETTSGNTGTTYTLDANGYTTGHTDDGVGPPDQTAGEVRKSPDWIGGALNVSPGTQMQIDDSNPGTDAGPSDYLYTRDGVTTEHSIIEVAFDLSQLDATAGNQFDLYWGPACDNDVISLTFHTTAVPAPPALPLFLSGLLGLGVLRRRKARR